MDVNFPTFFFFSGGGGVVYFLFSNKTANNICHFQCTVSVYLQENFSDSQTGIAASKNRRIDKVLNDGNLTSIETVSNYTAQGIYTGF